MNIAFRSGQVSEVLSVIDKVPNNQINYPIDRINGRTFLHLVIELSNRHKSNYSHLIIQALLDKGADINRANNNGQSSIFFLGRGKATKTDILEYLISKGGDINKKDHAGNTPLHFYVQRGSAAFIASAIKFGASVNVKNNVGESPFMRAAKKGRVDIMRSLFKNGAKADTVDKNNSSSLHYAAQSADINSIEYLLKLGLDINFRGDRDQTALSILAERRKWSVVRILLELGADPYVPMRKEPSVAYHLVMHPELGMAGLFDSSKIDVNFKPKFGSSPLLTLSTQLTLLD